MNLERERELKKGSRLANPANSGLHFQYYRLEVAAELLGAEPITVSFGYNKAFEGKRGVTYFPATPGELSAFDLVVMNDLPVAPHPMAHLKEDQLEILRKYVENGGALLIIGGHNAFGGGRHGESPLAELLPVGLKERFDLEWLNPPLTLSPAKGYCTDVDWKRPPVVLSLHTFVSVRPGAKVPVKAGEAPAIVVWRWKNGSVGIIGATCYGIPPEGRVAFWDGKSWPEVLAGTIQWLTDGKEPSTVNGNEGQGVGGVRGCFCGSCVQ